MATSKEMSKGVKILIVLAVLLALGGSAFAGYKIGQKKEEKEEEEPKKKASAVSNPNLKKETFEPAKEFTVAGQTKLEPV